MKLFLLFVAILTSHLSASSQVRYGFMTKTGSFVTGNNTSYVQTVDNIDAATITNNAAIEIAGTGNIFTHKGIMYYVNFNEPRIIKYTVNPNGSLNQVGTILLPDGPQLPHIVDFKIIDDNTAYAMSYGVWQVFIINTNTMSVIGTVDLNSINKIQYETSTLEEIVVRDGKMYIGIWYGSGLQNANAIDTAYVAIVDIASRSLDKVITDPRTYLVGYGCSAIDMMHIDEAGDIYVSGSDLTSGGSGKRPGGVLRIKKGETEFDPNYFVNLDQLCGNRKTIGMWNLGDGVIMTTAQYPEAINILNPLSKYLDPTLRYWRVDLKTQTAQVVAGAPYTRGLLFGWLTKIANNQYLLPIGGENNDNSLYQYNYSTNSATKKVQLEGEPFGTFPLNKDATVGILKVDNNLSASLLVFPNPVVDEINVLISSKNGGTASVSVSDITGKVMLTKSLTLNQGDELVSFDAQYLPSGVYTITIVSQEGIGSMKFVK